MIHAARVPVLSWPPTRQVDGEGLCARRTRNLNIKLSDDAVRPQEAVEVISLQANL